jgi:hypothetical protein
MRRIGRMAQAERAAQAERMAQAERAVGKLLLLTAVAHLGVGAVGLRAPLAALARDGVLGAVGPVEAQPERHAALWFMLSGVLFGLLGHLADRTLSAGGRLPASLGWGLLGAGGLGAALLRGPSGFWALLPQGLLALRAARTAGGAR